MIPAPRPPSDAPVPALQFGDGLLGGGMLGDVTAMGIEELREQRRLLAEELRGLRYWRRVAQAQMDLLVASLVYNDHCDLDGLHGAAAPHRRPDAGARLERLRQRSAEISAHELALREDMEAVTTQLATRVVESLTDPATVAEPTSPTR